MQPDDARLVGHPDPAFARKILMGFVPPDDALGQVRARMLAFLGSHPDALRRSCVTGHLTASALLIDHAGERALLTHHRKLDRWLQLGGHCDGDGNLAAVALREAQEESGIAELQIDARPVDLDIHTIPARGDEPEHLHLDTRFFVYAPEGAEPRISDESHDLRWFAPHELEKIATDDSVARLFLLAFPG